ncbi:hypothetical protein [Sporomusa sphaeroides]|uniref:Uncharacterized protein n=1 Tax=Sporomusa sphaeroides DSM 2875 TaxID=1337886 RepID=A0ABP2C369_9FIRM|nr:hypothetical protein [Sporomusa sphaeroides]OLS56355.1 hypothetical protein SPSPH_27480 [Sporomusa sphaeroides DSM 2875]CVK18450.1 hypothetical protein SSPH_01088 [Sporomusa sphaeroides DSM 2875]
MDIALVLDRIRPGAAWRMSDTYENLKNTWEDTKQTLPTLAEIEAAWTEMQAEAGAPVTPPVDQDTADMWEAILALSAKIEVLEGK